MADAMASGTNPGTTYTIFPSSDPGVYHEDRVVVTEVGSTYITQMFRVYGATFDDVSSKWSFVGATAAYATVQNPDGSIHYFTYSGTSPWLTSAWQGSDNNTVYNAVDFGLAAGGIPSDNSDALTSTFTAIFNATPPGGGVWVPEFGYPVNSSPTGIQVPYNTILQGMGTSGLNRAGATGEFHFSINGTGGSPGSGNTFFVVTGAHTSGGTLLQNLGFSWIDSTNENDTCINAEIGWNLRVTNCFFLGCPIVMNCDALASGLDGSAIKYQAGSPNNAVAVILQSPQCFAAGPGEYAQDAVNPSEGGGEAGPTNCVAVMICGGPSNGEHCWVRDVHLSEFSYGVCFNTQNAWGGTDFCTATLGADGAPINSGSQDAVVTNVECQAFVTAVYIQPKSDTDPIYGVKVSDSYLVKCQNSTDGRAIAYVDTNGGANQNVSDVEFVSCTIFSDVTTSDPNTGAPQNGQYGLQLNAGDNLRVIGGRISNMGTKSTPQNDGTANIAITGAVGLTTIDAVNLSAAAAIATQQRPSQWGLLVTGDITGPITVSNCNFGTSGWGASGPASVTGTVSASNPLYITNCPGYNDRNTPLNGGMAPLSAVSAAACSTPYFGPSVFTWTSTTPVTVHVFGSSYTANSGIIFLPSAYDTFSMSTTPLAFSWIGK